MDFEKYKEQVFKADQSDINFIKICYKHEYFFCYFLYEKNDKIFVIALNDLIMSNVAYGDIMVINRNSVDFQWCSYDDKAESIKRQLSKKYVKEYKNKGEGLYGLYNVLGDEKYRWKNYKGEPTPKWDDLDEPQKKKWIHLALMLHGSKIKI